MSPVAVYSPKSLPSWRPCGIPGRPAACKGAIQTPPSTPRGASYGAGRSATSSSVGSSRGGGRPQQKQGPWSPAVALTPTQKLSVLPTRAERWASSGPEDGGGFPEPRKVKELSVRSH